jgi:multiple sugar transport system substrate-binding protein
MATRLTRREMLKLSGTLVAGGVLASCATPTPTEPPAVETEPPAVETEPPVVETEPPPVEGNVVVMHFRHELTEDEEAQFEGDNPAITMDFVNADLTRFFAMYAAGDPPDLLRVQAPSVPQFLARNMLYDLTPYFEASDVLILDDLAPANDYYKANSPLEVGDGPIYGMCKDFSPDFTIFAYTQAFEDVGLDVPSDTERLTYAEVADLAAQLAQFEGDRTTMFGLDYETGWTDRIMMNMLAELDMNIYTDDFSAMAVAASEEATATAEYFYNLAADMLTASPINPSPSWIGGDFNQGICAMLQYGYWFSAMAETEITAGLTVMLPGATWSGVARDPTMTATGMIMAGGSDNPDAAWKVFEWYNGLEPAIARAGSGWGVPALISMYDMMPSETEFQQQVQAVLQTELALETPPIQFNPFLGEATANTSWLTHLQRALQGEITFDEMLADWESEVNTAIQEGVDRIL